MSEGKRTSVKSLVARTMRENERFEKINSLGEVSVDDIQMARPAIYALQRGQAVRNAAQNYERNIEGLTGPIYGVGFHVHHVGVDGRVSVARHDVGSGREPGDRKPWYPKGKGQLRR